ncbi:MAG TPA: hypothetical protein VLB74_04660 [Flavobacterium sp.]|uniref:heavy-metal-associated domain-containing protein n=1 Tax=Flavobacterium sp. TaxID=239 RepID=UPI002BA3211C|nr:metal transporter [Flavobacterium sp.]HSD13918.1 hypothetical protein [Flavobacterium sp.]
MKKIMIVLLVSLFGFAVQAQEKKNKNAKADVEVKGNCDMCKKRIEKAAYSVAGVKSAVWHSEDQVLHLVYNEQKCSMAEVEKAVAKAGHDTKDVKAPVESYDSLHECCQYDR